MKRLLYILTTVCLLVLYAGCTQGIDEYSVSVGQGQSQLCFNVEFRPMSSQLTRTSGDAIRHIESLCMVVYKEDGSLYGRYPITSFETGEPAVPSNPNSEFDSFAESTTCRAQFTLQQSLPYGKYRFYVVANYTPTDAQAASEQSLRSITLNWNASDVASNNVMFGFFTTEDRVPTVNELREQAPLQTINQSQMSLYGWLRRMVSKVTVAFNGSNLYDNVYIYIHSVQIKDIPTSCAIGAQNSPQSTSQLIANGEVTYFRPTTSTDQTAGLMITKGVPTGGRDNSQVHSQSADALYLFENMQGTSTDKHQYKNYDSKDNKPYGSYIEVKGYYVNKTSDNASQGEIIYRFMLGKDVTSDFNTERNNHYKLTLCFKNNANDPDWHIEYEPENSELSVPTPLYISYGYNEVLNIPVVVRGATVSSSTTIKATIVENPWGYPEHKYYGKSNHEDLNDGFLTFENLKGTVSISESTRNSWSGAGKQYVSGIKPTTVDVDACQYVVPVYTRPLILANSLTGHNPYVSYQRKAKVRFEVVLDGETITQDIDVIQVKRLVNPTGVWRSDSNTTPFNVRLMELNEPDTNEQGMVETSFEAPLSDGPWTAHIEQGADWVQIAPTGSGNWGTEDVVGATGTEIRFDYRPKSANSSGAVRCGVIRVTYHNNHCVHYIFVSQGVGTVNLAGSNWQNRNVLYKNKLVDNPLMEGSMFKFGNPSAAILVENNHRDGYGFDVTCWGKSFNIHTGSARSTSTFEAITYNSNGFTSTRVVFTDTSIKPATYDQWKALETLHRRYGVLYGDECTETMTTTTEAYAYYQAGQKRGMQGMFVWDESREGNHVFFPIGSTGYGHRKVNDNAYSSIYGTIDKYSHLKYAQRPLEMPEATAKAVPMYYDLYIRKGAIYWYDVVNSAAVEFDGNSGEGYAHDTNYHSMLFQTFGKNAVGQKDRNGTVSSDAAFIRCVEN